MKKTICTCAAIAALTLAGAARADQARMTKQHIVASANAESSASGLAIVLVLTVLVAAAVTTAD